MKIAPIISALCLMLCSVAAEEEKQVVQLPVVNASSTPIEHLSTHGILQPDGSCRLFLVRTPPGKGSEVEVPFGGLKERDEVISIDGRSVSSLKAPHGLGLHALLEAKKFVISRRVAVGVYRTIEIDASKN